MTNFKSVLYCSYMKDTLDNKVNELFEAHIKRLQKDIAERNGRLAVLTEIDLKNIASLREGRVPEYGDHLPNNCAGPMWEFDDIVDALAK